MKRSLLFFVLVALLSVSGKSYADDAVARIYAYDLNRTESGDNYTFTFKANEVPTSAALVFYSASTGRKMAEKALSGPFVKGENSVTLSKSELLGGGEMYWGIKLSADAITSFGKVFESSKTYNRLHATVDNSPESDYFQRIYMTNNGTVGKGIFIYNQDYTEVNTSVLTAGLTWGSPARLDVDAYGKVWISDWSDGDAAGVWILDPKNTSSVSQFFDFATKTSKGQYKNASGVEIGEGNPAVGVFGEGKDMIVYVAGEEGGTTLKKNGLNIYHVGQSDGSVLYKWNVAPSVIANIKDNDNGTFSYGTTSHGVFMGQNRSANQNASGNYAAMFYDNSGTQRWNSNTTNHPEINGCNGSGLGVSWDEKRMAMVDASSHLLVYDITWNGDVPSLSLAGTYNLDKSFAGTIDFDYAGNIVATLGSAYGASTMNGKLYVYALPTNDNSCTVPAKKSLKISKPLSGSYNIGGENADFASLAAACKAINEIGIEGDVTLLICANLTEPVNPVLRNGTNYSITIRPDQDADRKISFTSSTDNYGPSGAFIIGGVRETISGHDTIAWNTGLTNNIIINGYAEGSSTRRLTFDTPSGHANSFPILFYGDVHNSKIINCIVHNTKSSGTTAITIRTANMSKLASGTPDKRPENILVENNIIAPTKNGQGVVINGTGATNKGDGAPIGTIIRNNKISASNRVIFLNGVNGLTIENNELTLNGAAGFNAHAVFGNAQVIGNIVIKNNVFKITTLQTVDADNGAIGIGSSGSISGRENEVQWIIDNNYFYGMDALASPSGKFKLMYIRAADKTTIRHNTFYIPAFTNTVPMDLVAAKCASAIYFAGTKEYIAQNNILVCAETASNVSLIRGTIDKTKTKNNVFFHNGGKCVINAAETVSKTWEEFMSNIADAGSKWAAPVFSNAATGDLGIVEANADLMVARLNDVLKDMFGNDRNNPTYAGACEPVAVTAITGVPATLTLEDINDTHTFTATVEPTNTSFPTITWSSDNESVATVSAAGVVTAQGAGTATVTATAGGFSVNCLVTVNAAHSLSGTYRIGGANSDFATLHAACEQINTYGLKGDATLLICADLTESQNSCLVNTSDYTITIRPDADADRTISFTQASDNVGPSGAFVIGLSNLAAFTAIPTKNIVIDGLASSEATHRMTIKTPSTYGSLAGPIIFYGHVTNSSIKNCIVINEMVHTTKNIYGITFRNEKNTDNAPEGVLVENNLVIVTAGKYGHCINFNGQEASTKYAGAPKNNIVRNNELQASTRAVFLYGANGATIEGNTIKVNYAYSGVINHGVMGLAQTGIITVRNNKFLELKTANTADENGIRAITATGGASKWIIENNYFGGLEATENVASKNVLLEYIYCDDLCEIRHNTFYMPSLSHSPATALNSATPVSCVQLKSSAAHIVKNNIFLSEETTANNSLISGTLNDNILSNVFYHNGGNAALTSSGSAIGDLNASNKWMPIAFTESYKLDFESANNSLIAVTPISGITTDIEGRTRTNPTHAGCYEPSWGLVLNEEADDNADAIDAKDGQTMDVLLKRHFSVDDGLYTLVLPFDLDNEQLEEAFGVGYKLSVMQTAYFKTSDALYLKFGFVDHLEAGVPCLLRVGNDVTEDILFRDVTIDNADPVKNVDNVVEMRGLYDMTNVPAAATNYYLGTDDYLFRYTTAIDTKAFRSYFYFPGFATSAPPRVARVIFREEVATDDLMIEDAPATAAPEKIIRDGEMLIIVDGVEYDMMGRPRVR